MNYLFIHQNFPGQFKFLAPALAAEPGNTVVAMPLKKQAPGTFNGVRVLPYQASRGSSKTIHPWAMDIETKMIRAEACFRASLQLREKGFTPDVIIAHPGWGESLFLDEVWPRARIGMYCEFFYRAVGADVGFDPEFPTGDETDVCRLRMKNVNSLLHFETVTAGISPTHWQADSFPQPFRSRISVIHDGIATDYVVPNPNVAVTVAGHRLTRDDEVITFVNRNLEPTRGYHVFMRALPQILKERPKARVMIVGGDDVSYGRRPDEPGKSWKEIFLAEVAGRIDRSRVHFVGHLAYKDFVALLQLSTVHVYLTYPFVLSWSLLEAMSAGCAIVGSDTGPLREAIRHNETGRLVDFFDIAGLAGQVCALMDNPAERARLGANAREFARANYDVERICLPRQREWVRALERAPNNL